MPIPPESLQPAHDKLRDIWQTSATEEERLQELIRNTPDPVFQGGSPDPVREDMIRSFEIVRAHRRFTRSCIDYLSWGEPVEKLPHFSDKTKAERATEAAAAFGGAVSIAADDCITALYNLGHNEEDGGRDVTEENVRAIARNLRYALDSAKADLRKGIR
jgi:hypothetical protein